MNSRKPIFVIHKHQATRLHYDLRLEIGGQLKSWALRSIPIKANQLVLAIQVADHAFWYRHFEGVIPEGKYGAGPVMIWDKGLFSSFSRDFSGKKILIDDSLEHGFLLIFLEGQKLKGSFALIRISKKQKWLFIKLSDDYVYTNGRMPSGWQRSVKSNKTLEQIFKEQKK